MTDEKRDYEAFKRVLDNLEIELTQSSDGILTVCSTSEPLFCFDVYSKEEAAERVSNTLVSYARHFFHLEGLNVQTEDQPFAASPVPIERATPVSRLKPVFAEAA